MAERSVRIALGGRAWNVQRARLGGFLRLQQARESLNKGIEEADNGQIVDGLFEFLRVCIPDLAPVDFHSAPWYEVFAAYLEIERLNTIPEADTFAILKFRSMDSKRVPWDNPLRAILIWIHLIAKTYSWAKNEIENLWPEQAVAFVTEIMADEHAEHEFIHSLSDVSYEYKKATGKSHYKPLKRPAWMTHKTPHHLITKFRRDLVPVGRVLYPEQAEDDLKPVND